MEEDKARKEYEKARADLVSTGQQAQRSTMQLEEDLRVMEEEEVALTDEMRNILMRRNAAEELAQTEAALGREMEAAEAHQGTEHTMRDEEGRRQAQQFQNDGWGPRGAAVVQAAAINAQAVSGADGVSSAETKSPPQAASNAAERNTSETSPGERSRAVPTCSKECTAQATYAGSKASTNQDSRSTCSKIILSIVRATVQAEATHPGRGQGKKEGARRTIEGRSKTTCSKEKCRGRRTNATYAESRANAMQASGPACPKHAFFITSPRFPSISNSATRAEVQGILRPSYKSQKQMSKEKGPRWSQ